MRLSFVCLIPVLTGLSMGCAGSAATQPVANVQAALLLQPDPPKVGTAEAIVTLTGQDGQAIQGAMVKLEGNMNHAGMEPVFADARESDPGHYQAVLEFTMGGDWYVLVNATLPDGRKLSQKIDVVGVKSR